MSCRRISGRVAAIVGRVGLPKLVSQTVYLTGLRRFADRLAQRLRGGLRLDRQDTPVDLRTVSRLDSRPNLTPTTPSGPCTGCDAPADKPGPWYRITGRPYCCDCAPQQARQNDVGLSVPATRTTGSASPDMHTQLTAPDAGTMIRLKEQSLDVALPNPTGGPPRLVRVDNAFAVWRGQRPTGLALTPTLDPKSGQTGDTWTLTHLDTGLPLAGPLRDLEQASALAKLLADFDWNQPLENLPASQLARVRDLITDFQTKLAALEGDKATQTWRDRDLDGRLVLDGFGDLARVVEDLGGKLRLLGPDGPYLMPRNMVGPPTAEAYAQNNLAQPTAPPVGQSCARCNAGADDPDATWYAISGRLICDTCAPAAASETGLRLPEDWLVDQRLPA